MSVSNDAPAWFFVENGAQQGPFTRAQMGDFARSARVRPDTLVWAQGAPGWVPLRDSPLRGLFAAGATPPPLPPYAPQPAPAPPGAYAYAPAQPGYAPSYGAPGGWAPSPSLGFGAAISACLGKYATFRGRARRSEYWYFQLFSVLVSIVTAGLDLALFGQDGGISPLSGLSSLALFLPSLAVLVRRLHDTDRSGWHFWWILIPLVGWIVLLVFMLQRGTDGPNRFG